MSQEEQDAILGKLIREQSDAKRGLAAIDTKLEEYATSLRAWSELALATARPGYTPHAGDEGYIPTEQELKDLIAEKMDRNERLSRIQSRLRESGAL